MRIFQIWHYWRFHKKLHLPCLVTSFSHFATSWEKKFLEYHFLTTMECLSDFGVNFLLHPRFLRKFLKGDSESTVLEKDSKNRNKIFSKNPWKIITVFLVISRLSEHSSEWRYIPFTFFYHLEGKRMEVQRALGMWGRLSLKFSQSFKKSSNRTPYSSPHSRRFWTHPSKKDFFQA